jgi:excisionase family DNA binding protein
MERTERIAAEIAPPLMTVAECAELARVSKSYIRKLVDRGTFRAVRVGENPGAPLRIETQSFLAWLYEAAPEEQATIQPSDLQPWVDLGGWVTEEPS